MNSAEYDTMNMAFEAKEWRKLSPEALDALINVVISEDKNEVYGRIFQGIDFSSEFGKAQWAKLNRLDALKLIWIQRNEKNQVLDFVFHPDIRQILSEEYPDKFLQAGEFVQGYNLEISPYCQSILAGDNVAFKGSFELDQSILLPNNTNIQFRITPNGDGTLSIFFSPVYPHSSDFPNSELDEESGIPF